MLKISPNGLGCLKKSDPNHHLRDCEANLVHYLVFILSSSSSAPFNDRLIVSCHIPCSSFHPHALSHVPMLQIPPPYGLATFCSRRISMYRPMSSSCAHPTCQEHSSTHIICTNQLDGEMDWKLCVTAVPGPCYSSQ